MSLKRYIQYPCPSSSPILAPNISAHHSPLGCMGIQVHVISQRIGGLFDIAPCPMNMLPAQCTHPTYSSRRMHVVASFIILTCEATVPKTYSLYPVGSSFVAASILCQLSCTMLLHKLLHSFCLAGISFVAACIKLGTMTMCFVRIILHS